MKQCRTSWKKVKIKTQITTMYISILLCSLILTFSVIFYLNGIYTRHEVGDAAVQTVYALQGNLSLIFENVTQFSDLTYFDDEIQSSLKEISSRYIDPKMQKNITKSLINMILSGDYISSVFIIDNYQNYYNSYKLAPKKANIEKIYETNWYQELQEKNGNGFFVHGSEGVIEFYQGNDYLTYIREIRDKNTYEPLAILMLTIDNATIQSYFNEVSDKYDRQFFSIDGEGNYVIAPTQYGEEIGQYLQDQTLLQGTYQQIMMGGESMMLAGKDMGFQDWRLVGLFKMDSMKAMAPYYTTVLICIMCLNVIVVFICSVLLTRLIFRPLEKMEKHMQLVENGTFLPMQTDDSQNEISTLKHVFNRMILSMQELLSKVKEEEQIIAQNELNLLQAQINPHFLYNTLDAVSALALLQDYDNCFRMTQALGNFYRNSLNSGMNVVTIKDEISCIQSYITILNMRYEDKIKTEYHVEEQLWDIPVLKLLLQPVVENAVHHGIKGNDGCGRITIEIFEDEDEIIFMVSDDGIGMSEDRIQEIMEGRTVTGKSGFGIYNLKQRISLYYGIKDPIMIHSEPGTGTEVTIRIKKIKEELPHAH